MKRKGEFGQRQGQTDDTLSTPTNNRGRGFPSNSASFPGGSTSPPRPNTNDSSTPISVIASALPDNTPEDSQPTEAPRVPPFSRPSNTSNRPFSFLHHNNPRSDNHYVSSTSVPSQYYYASSLDNPRSGDTVRLEEAYQEPSSMDIANHAYEGTTDNEDVNVYHYASSSEFPMVVSTGATNPEKAYEESFNMDMAEHAYEGTSDDLEQSRTTIEDRFCRGFSMKSRPLPHRPSSANCKEGPTLPPRKSSRSSKNAIHAIASLRQRKCVMHNENNNILLGACSSDSKVIHDLPKKHATSNKRKGKTETPLYHTLEDNEQPKRCLQHDNKESPPLRRPQGGTLDPFYHCLEKDNQGSYSGDNHLAYGVPVTSSTNAQDSTDSTDSVRMINNILYVPMPTCSKTH
eukprot:XP_011665462.1 PREDICTED: uncharacterized protein LOC105438842 isoform X2 [Strongylocentrotus purpuratus]